MASKEGSEMMDTSDFESSPKSSDHPLKRDEASNVEDSLANMHQHSPSAPSSVSFDNSSISNGYPVQINGDLKAEAGSHIKTESPDTLASSDAIYHMVNEVAALNGDTSNGHREDPMDVKPPIKMEVDEQVSVGSRNGDSTPDGGEATPSPQEKNNNEKTDESSVQDDIANERISDTNVNQNGGHSPHLPPEDQKAEENACIAPQQEEPLVSQTTTPPPTFPPPVSEDIIHPPPPPLPNDLPADPQPPPSSSSASQLSMSVVLEFLRKHNLQETERILKRECKQPIDGDGRGGGDALVESGELSVYKSEGDPNVYMECYEQFKTFVDQSLDSYKHELYLLLYPVFVHMYLELVYNCHETQAEEFMQRYGSMQEEFFEEDVRQLSTVRKREHMLTNELMQNLRASQYTVKMCRDTFNHARRFLQDKKNSLIHEVVQEHVYIDVYEGLSRSRQQVESMSGSLMGESTKSINKVKVYYGLPKEPQIIVDDEDDNAEDAEGKPKKKKSKKDSAMNKKSRNDPNAPPSNRIPMPELRDADKFDKIAALKEAAKRVKLGSGSLPSICFYTLVNSHLQTTAVEINEDSSMMAVGLQDCRIKVFSLTPNKLKSMKNASDLENIDREADDVLFRMMDERTATDCRILIGHQGAITSLSFSPDHQYLLSGSEDSTIRLWSLLTWSNVVSYRGHLYPVWDVKFSPVGYYFASCGHDRTARLWATDSYQPLRVFAGHYSDVECVQFHPNCNYVATGSTDRTIRLWDVLNGQCVRYMTGHKSNIYSLVFSSCGRFLCSAAGGGKILVYDISTSHLIAELWSHTDTVYRLTFSREGTILATGGLDCCVKLWDFEKLVAELDMEEMNMSNMPSIRTNTDGILLGSYPTKQTSILTLHFTRKNLLLASGSPV